MKNFIATGNTLTITAEADIASGAGVLIGSIFGVATGPIANGAEGVINLTGVYDLPKTASQAWTVGAKVYWDKPRRFYDLSPAIGRGGAGAGAAQSM